MQAAPLQCIIVRATFLDSGFLDLLSDLIGTVNFEVGTNNIIVNPTLNGDDAVIRVCHIVHLLHLSFNVDDVGERYLDPGKIVSLVNQFGGSDTKQTQLASRVVDLETVIKIVALGWCTVYDVTQGIGFLGHNNGIESWSSSLRFWPILDHFFTLYRF